MRIFVLLLMLGLPFAGIASAGLNPEINFTGPTDNYSTEFAIIVFGNDSQPVAIGGEVIWRTNNTNATSDDIRVDAVWIKEALALSAKIAVRELSPEEIMQSRDNLSEKIKTKVLAMKEAKKSKIEISQIVIRDIDAYNNVYCVSENNGPMGFSIPRVPARGSGEQFAAAIFFLFVGIMIGIVSINYIEKKK